jgi:hypothetical protein
MASTTTVKRIAIEEKIQHTVSFTVVLDENTTMLRTEPFHFIGWTWSFLVERQTDSPNYGVYLCICEPLNSFIKVQDVGLLLRQSGLITDNCKSIIKPHFDKYGTGFKDVIKTPSFPSSRNFELTITSNKSYRIAEALEAGINVTNRVEPAKFDDLIGRLATFSTSDHTINSLDTITEFNKQLLNLQTEQKAMLTKLNDELNGCKTIHTQYTETIIAIKNKPSFLEKQSKCETKINLLIKDIDAINNYMQLVTERLAKLEAVNLVTPTDSDICRFVNEQYNKKMDEFYEKYDMYDKELKNMNVLSELMTSSYKEHIAALILDCNKHMNRISEEAVTFTNLFNMHSLAIDIKYNPMLNHETATFDDAPTFVIDPCNMRCSITMKYFKKPVIAADGYTYEEDAIKEWFRTNDRSPMTNLTLANKVLTPNYNMMSLVKSRHQ